MLTIPLEKVCFIIVKAREYDEKEPVVDPDEGSNPSDDRAIDILEDLPDDPTFEELSGAITGLNEDEQIDLVALAWIGREDYSAEEWEEARSEAADVRDKHVPDYLLGMPQLGDLLEEGLAALGHSCEDFEMGRL